VSSPSEDKVDLGGFPAVFANADGDDWWTPSDYPAPELRHNSLFVGVGGLWYQGGTDKTFVPLEDGELVLSPNDGDMSNNSRGWHVTITISPPPGT
jgi:hypothetical protein